MDGKAAAQHCRILDAIRAFGPISRNELAALFSPEGLMRDGTRWFAAPPRIRLASVCGRVNALVGSDERYPVRVHHTAPDPDTKHPVDYLVADDPAPLERTFSKEQFTAGRLRDLLFVRPPQQRSLFP
jgi:hypothetical protein